jgi:hypothetical protein
MAYMSTPSYFIKIYYSTSLGFVNISHAARKHLS